jgi:hypothetical protein
MYCPSCGVTGTIGQKFCRSCGMDLQMISEMVAGRLPAADAGVTSDLDKTRAHRMIKFMGWGGIVLFIGLITLALGKKYLHDNLLELIGGLVILAGTFVMGYGLLSALLSATKQSRQFQRQGAQTEPQLHAQLPLRTLPEPAPSIVERTTRLMENVEVKPSEDRSRGESRS